MRSRALSEAEHPVQRDRAEDQGADQRLLPEVGDAEDRQHPVDGDQQHRADGRAPDGAAAAEDRDAADHHGRDGLELDAGAGARS